MICCAIIIIIVLIFLCAPLILFVGIIAFPFISEYGGGKDTGSITFDEALSLEYPYRRLFTTEDQLESAFKKISEYECKLVQTSYKIINIPDLPHDWLFYQGKPTICETLQEDYYSMNWISDWFNEKCRLKCRRYDELESPLEYWEKNKNDVIKKVEQTGNITICKLNDEMYNRVLGCNNFRPGLMRGIIKLFNAKSVLDPSAGWGDRLIGACAAGVRYVGVDPNTCLYDGYREIVDKFAPDKTKYLMIEAPFQTAELPEETYDLVFTSPPYFDLEIYSDEPSQSVYEFPGLEEWFTKFLMVTLNKAWNVLNVGGYMIININNIRNKPDFVMRMIAEINKFPRATRLGVISYAEKIGERYKSPQPMWIWQKTDIISGNDSQLFFNNESAIELKVADINEFMEFCNINNKVHVDADWTNVGENEWLITSDMINSCDSIYYGSVLFSQSRKNVWRKQQIIANPKVILEKYGKISVVRDDILPGGTKQRAHGIISNVVQNEVVYAGPWSGFAQVALAIAGKLHNKLVTIFMTRDDYKTNIRARMYGARIIVEPNANLKQLQALASDYASKQNAYLMPFGFDSMEFRRELTSRIIEAIDGVIDREFAETIWLVAGSGTLVNVLYEVFPRARFGVVQVGKKIWDDQLDLTRTVLYIAPEGFYDDAKYLPPYPSAVKYDAKVWQYVTLNGAAGDIVWNVAGH